MAEHFDLCGCLDGFAVSYRGHQIHVANTWTGAIRAMTQAAKALDMLEQLFSKTEAK